MPGVVSEKNVCLDQIKLNLKLMPFDSKICLFFFIEEVFKKCLHIK